MLTAIFEFVVTAAFASALAVLFYASITNDRRK